MSDPEFENRIIDSTTGETIAGISMYPDHFSIYNAQTNERVSGDWGPDGSISNVHSTDQNNNDHHDEPPSAFSFSDPPEE